MELKGAEAAEITQQERARSTDIEIYGVFRIIANDVSKASGFRIKLERISDGTVLSADVPINYPMIKNLCFNKPSGVKVSSV